LRRLFIILLLSVGVTATLAQDEPAPPLEPASAIEFDQFVTFDIPALVQNGLNRPHIAFLNENNSESITSLATPLPNTDRALLFYVDPANEDNRYTIAEFGAETLEEIYLSPLGNSFAYFIDGSAGPQARGLWYADTSIDFGARIWDTDSLTLRGLPNVPAWSPDGRRLAITLETGYHLDIFQFNLDESRWEGLVRDSSFNFWPSWSPDGRYLAFVSDRETCPSWDPADDGFCNSAVEPTPTSGDVYVLEIATGVVTRVSAEPTFEPPYWVNANALAFSSGDPFNLLDPQRGLWLASLPAMTSQQVRLPGTSRPPLYLAESWSPTADRVIFQNATGNTTEIVIAARDGTRLDTIDQVSFARYTLAANWSPDGERLTVGGTSGQCPNPLRVFETANFSLVSTPTQPTNVCTPRYAPDGQFIAYTAINTLRSSNDGRRDIYVSSAEGFQSDNLTINDFRGQMTLLGWVGR
jgi:Tol biopolymer transport system component